MPNLAQMYSLANAKTSYSRRRPEIYAALDKGGFKVYTAVLKEFSGFFVKFDTETVSLAPGVAEYPLPPDCTQLVHVAERPTGVEHFRPIEPESISSALERARQGLGWYDWAHPFRESSRFRYAGPYLDAVATTGSQTQKIRISPIPQQPHAVELCYTAKWLPIVNESSVVMLPEEGTHAMLDYAIAELHRSNDDTLSAEYAAEARMETTDFLTWVRDRQIQGEDTIEPYLG